MLSNQNKLDLEKEIGSRAIDDICKFQSYLSTVGRKGAQPILRELEGRFAPSVITRSEIELFGIEYPRFCVRLYLDDNGSFVNCRRIPLLIANILGGKTFPWSSRVEGLSEEDILKRITPDEGLKQIREEEHSVVADCLLIPPAALSQKYKIITTKLQRAYGEALDDRSEKKATPYMQHIDVFGGGMCAQAVCFIVAALLHNYTTGVHGIVEITYIAAAKAGRELCTAGLELDETVRYFRNIGLSASLQVPTPDASNERVLKDLRRCLDGYISSNFPVIFSADRRNLEVVPDEKNSLYGRNNYHTDPLILAATTSLTHAIVLIGRGLEDGASFLAHDPGSLPFLELRLQDLLDVSYFPSHTSDFCLCIPVVPPEVKMPLMWEKESESHIPKPGLIEISKLYHARQLLSYPRFGQEMGIFYLYQLTDNIPKFIPRNKDRLFVEAFASLREDLYKLGLSDHWIWFEIQDESVLLWNAEVSLSTLPTQLSERYKKVLLGALHKDQTGNWSKTVSSITAKPLPRPAYPLLLAPAEDVQDTLPITLSLISSFENSASLPPLISWPSEIRFAEVYMCMQNIAEDLFHEFFPSPLRSASAYMAKGFLHRERDFIVERIVDRLKEKFADIEIIGFASFLPGISSRSTEIAEEAALALKFLLLLAQRISTVRFVELVAGSRIDGLWPGRDLITKENVYVANYSTREISVDRFFKNLQPITDYNNTLSRPVYLSVEMEPGPIYTLGNMKTLELFCNKLKDNSTSDTTKKFLGYNLDIAHWAFLSTGLTPEILDRPEIGGRIVHAHISDHFKGHFCDNAVSSIHTQADFFPWLQKLSKLKGQFYQGFLSCEMECAKSELYLKETIKQTKSLLRQD
jgi:sugar phosphate isomerase/epimerase